MERDANLSVINNPDFNRIITSSSFIGQFMSRDIHAQNFVVENFHQILMVGMRTKKEKGRVVVACIAILSSIQYPFLNEIYEKTNLALFLTNYPHYSRTFPPGSMHIYFRLLSHFIYSHNNKVLAPYANQDFFYSLIDLIDNYPATEFLSEFIATANSVTITLLRNLGFCYKLFDCMKDERKKEPALELLGIALKSGFQYHIIDVLCQEIDGDSDILDNDSDNENRERYIKQLIRTAIDQKDFCFIYFLRDLFAALKSIISYSKAKKLIDDISSFKESFCLLVLNDKRFSRLSDAASNLVIDIHEINLVMYEQLTNMACKLVRNFFDFTMNNFLHNTVVRMFHVIQKTGRLSYDFLGKTEVVSFILDAYTRKKENVGISYWAQARDIATLLSTFDISKFVSLDLWNRYVKRKINHESWIAKSEYGGYKPTIFCVKNEYDFFISISIIVFTFLAIIIIFKKSGK